MATLPPEKVQRLSRQMVQRFAKLPKQEPTEAGYFDQAARIACIMAEYPPAVIYLYLMLSLDQLVKGQAAIVVPGEGGE